MKTKIECTEFTPFTLTIDIETHKEFKELYRVCYDMKLGNIADALSAYSSENKISV